MASGVVILLTMADVKRIAMGAARVVSRKLSERAAKQAVEKKALEAAEQAWRQGGRRGSRETVEKAAQEAAAEKAAQETAEQANRGARLGSAAKGGGRGANNLKPDPVAQGPHSTFKTDPQGRVTAHAEWQPNPRNPSGFNKVKRVDTQYATPHEHTGVSTPHVHDKTVPGGIRPARPEELPR